eukprot:gene8920-12029_t
MEQKISAIKINNHIMKIATKSKFISGGIKNRRSYNEAKNYTQLTPLYPGYGTHFTYIYVGTPPQRQSVIIDTGSHFTAFPCTGCYQCGAHTDSYWNPNNSSSINIQRCGNGQLCQISQSYAEGSSWQAYKVVDRLWVGGTSIFSVPTAVSFAVDFMFGCQTSETGLFRTQLADGIMGMSIADDTLPNQLVKQGISKSKIFALCFRVGGGIMTLGGVDQRLHNSSSSLIDYAQIISTRNGWFGVRIMDVSVVSTNGAVYPLKLSQSYFENSYSGPIIDSGTTITYLPSSIQTLFINTFNKVFGSNILIVNSINYIILTEAQLLKLPTVVFHLLSSTNGIIKVSMPYYSYLSYKGSNKYYFDISFGSSGITILGANFMTDHNVIFDSSNNRVGFAESSCDYDSITSNDDSTDNSSNDTPEDSPSYQPTNIPSLSPTILVPPQTDCSLTLVSSCSAPPCVNDTQKLEYGVTAWYSPCTNASIVYKACFINCTGSQTPDDGHDTSGTNTDTSSSNNTKVSSSNQPMIIIYIILGIVLFLIVLIALDTLYRQSIYKSNNKRFFFCFGSNSNNNQHRPTLWQRFPKLSTLRQSASHRFNAISKSATGNLTSRRDTSSSAGKIRNNNKSDFKQQRNQLLRDEENDGDDNIELNDLND